MALTKPGTKSILVLSDWFEPGFKAGGPIRSCLNFAQQMKDKYAIYVITTDRDLHAKEPYPNVTIGHWTIFEEGINTLYCSPAMLSWKNVLQQIKIIAPDFIYMNSMYSRFFTIYPLLMCRLGLIKSKLILAPRGMLKPAAVQFKSGKKKLFFSLLKFFGLQKGLHFHATDNAERNDIKNRLGNSANVTVIPNFPGRVKKQGTPLTKTPGAISVIFIGRIHPIKNLDYLLRLLPGLKGNVRLTILGSEEEPTYVATCKGLAAALPANIYVEWIKELPYKQLSEIVCRHHLFVSPTQGENFGHAIFDAMSEGKPVLISDQTPWRNLAAAKAGWDINLADKAAFSAVLQQAVDLNQQEYNTLSTGAWQYAKQFVENANSKRLYLNLFS